MASVNLACVRSRGRYSQVTVGREIAPRQDLSREIAPRGRATRSLSSAEAKQRRPWLAGGGTCRRAYIHLGACEIEVQVSLKILGTLCRAAVWREPGGASAGTGAQRGVRCPPTPSRLFWYLWRHQRSLYQAINAHYAITTITLYGMHAYMCFWPMKGCLSCIFARRSTGNLEQAMDEGAAGSQIGGRTCPSEEFDACQSERWMIDWLAMVFP